jgi:hypothetical protein
MKTNTGNNCLTGAKIKMEVKVYSEAEVNDVPGFKKNREKLPFVFLEGHATHIRKSGQGEWFLFGSMDNRKFVPVRKFKSKFLTQIQILHAPLAEGKPMKGKDEREFMEVVLDKIRKEGIADRVCQPPTHVVFKSPPRGSIDCGFGTWYLTLEGISETLLWEGLHGKHRNVIRNAKKQGVEIRIGRDQLDAFYALYQATMKRSEMHCESFSYFQEYFDSHGSRNVICAVAYSKGIPQGALLIPHTEYAAYYVYGASADRMDVNGAVNYLHWEVILKMKALNVKRYDFVGARLSSTEGSRLAGIQQFKERFGSVLERGILWKTDIRELKCRMYDSVLKCYLWMRKIHLSGDIIDQERRKTAGERKAVAGREEI